MQEFGQDLFTLKELSFQEKRFAAQRLPKCLAEIIVLDQFSKYVFVRMQKRSLRIL